MSELWNEIKLINILSAVEQGFGIDPKYDDQLRALVEDGLIKLKYNWILTPEGVAALERLRK